MVVGGLRAAGEFVAPAWRRAWWLIVPCGLAWGMALSPLGGAPWIGAALVLTLIASTALYRQASGSTGSFAGALARVLAAWILTAVFLGVLGLLLFVILLCASYAVASAGVGFVPSEVGTWAAAVRGRGRVVLAIVGLAGCGALLWAATRIALGPVATVSSGRVRVLSAWPLTRGLGLSLLAARALTALPAGVLFALAGRMEAAVTTSAAGAWGVGMMAGLTLSGLWLPLNSGLMSYIYRCRAEDRSDPLA